MFGIPGDSITAIAIGVLYLKDMNPGPTMFINNPQNIYAVFIVFFLANCMMLPLGWLAIKVAKQVLRVPRAVLMPLILLFCIVGSVRDQQHACSASMVMLAAGILAFFMERYGFPIAPTILGVVLGTMLEEHFFARNLIVGACQAVLYKEDCAAKRRYDRGHEDADAQQVAHKLFHVVVGPARIAVRSRSRHQSPPVRPL